MAETARAKTILLDAPGWTGHRAGQHIDIRLTAEDGYQAQRSYSIASAPEDPMLALTVELIEDGEVSPYLLDELRAGDELELRGPIGGYFAWDASLGGPLMLLGGGSGVVPLRSMLRHHAAAADASAVAVRLLYSSREWDEVIYRGAVADGEFIAFWLQDQRVIAGMNVNVWEVNEDVQALVRSRRPIDPAAMRDKDTPLGHLANTG